jgi:hypothetical protein
MRKLIFALLFIATATFAQPNYDAFNAFLQKNVSSTGKVDYKNIKKNRTDFDKILTTLAAKTPEKSWSKNDQLAYWINVYNAYTIKLIVDNYPVKKITDLDGGKPWDVKRIELAGSKYSLNQIENEIIRPQFKDARIHFAINCAAKSCPPLLNKAFYSATLQSQLDSQTKKFVLSSANVLDAKTVKVSKIFDWYKIDFGVLTDFLNKYATVKVNKDAKIEFQDYNWNLNE